MADPVYTGVIRDKGGAVHNLRAYGALGDGTDDTAAIRNAIAAVPEGGTLYIPPGTFRITDTIHINRAISIEGSGPGSAFWLDLKSTTKTGIVIGLLDPVTGSVVSVAENQTYRNFGVFGANGSCKYGLALYHCGRSRFENIHVRPGSAEHAIVVGGCLYCFFNFTCSNNSTDGYPRNPDTTVSNRDPGLWNGAAVLVQDLSTLTGTTSKMPTNICVFDCILQAGGNTGGLAIKNQRYQENSFVGGNNQILGTYEGFVGGTGGVYGTGYGLLIDGCMGFNIHDAHVEANANGTWIKNSSQFTIRDANFYTGGAGPERIRVENSNSFAIDRVSAGRLSIGAECSMYTVTGFTGARDADQPARKNDSFHLAGANPGQQPKVTSGMAPFTTENLVPNGDLSRSPHGFAYAGIEPRVVRTETTRRFNRYALNVSSGAAPNMENRAVLSIPVPDSLRYVGQPVTIWADIKRSSGAPIALAIYESIAQSYTPLTAIVPSTETQWVRVATTYYPSAERGAWSVWLMPTTTEAYEYHLGGVGALVGVAAPMGVQSPAPSFQDGLQLTGKRMEYGSAAPSTGTWQPGDIVFNASPAAGGRVGWVCTAAGSPGTWKTFGAISA